MPVERLAENRRRVPLVGEQQAGDDVEKRGFSAAARSDDRDEGARRDVEGDAVDGRMRPESLDDVVECQRGGSECGRHRA